MSSPAMHKFDVHIISGTITTTSITMSEDLIMGTSDTVSASNNRVVKAADPINDQDLVTKSYADSISTPPFTVTLTGTNTTQISTATKGSFMVWVTNASGGAGPSTNGAGAIFAITKRESADKSMAFRIVGVKGLTSTEELSLVWAVSDTLKLKKSGAGHDGTYEVVVVGVNG